MSWRGSVSKHLRELRIHLCQTSPASQGVRDFVHKSYPVLKSANPSLPILVREAAGVRPTIYARYEHGKERKVSVENMNAGEVEKQVERLATEQ
ncbi:thioredoxin-like protein [Thamnocephalis sphaerospora]|uniref:Thioredoxin-like protein n=1 Tax=Thamnocephalis sphaerospora TaxID=78915 RepID=A0A4P9XPM0_9FUNG|nr:thioredoxin-like protein [Thamnocephalis sphaerospora]|eukprot:RKP07957.1 thioredoxin-like protein [Thamnocephalis sphaerospora]